MKRVGVGVIGTGFWGENQVRVVVVGPQKFAFPLLLALVSAEDVDEARVQFNRSRGMRGLR